MRAEGVGVAVALRRPHGEHHRQPRALAPERSQVVMRRRIGEGRVQRRVADHAGARRPPRPRARISAWGTSTLHEHDRRRRVARHGDRAHRGQRQLRDELHRLDGAVRADAERRQQDVALGVGRVLDARDVGDVELPRREQAVELGRHGHHLAHLVRVEVARERPLDREGVDVRDAAESQHQSKRRTTL